MPHAPNVEDDSLVQLSRLLDYERVRRLGLKFYNNIVGILQCYSGDEIVQEILMLTKKNYGEIMPRCWRIILKPLGEGGLQSGGILGP